MDDLSASVGALQEKLDQVQNGVANLHVQIRVLIEYLEAMTKKSESGERRAVPRTGVR